MRAGSIGPVVGFPSGLMAWPRPLAVPRVGAGQVRPWWVGRFYLRWINMLKLVGLVLSTRCSDSPVVLREGVCKPMPCSMYQQPKQLTFRPLGRRTDSPRKHQFLVDDGCRNTDVGWLQMRRYKRCTRTIHTWLRDAVHCLPRKPQREYAPRKSKSSYSCLHST
jgi:hypothetical protein